MTRGVRTVTGVRYDRDLEEFQMRCGDCSRRGLNAYWPMTLEFWEPKHGLTRCRACWKARRAAELRERYRTDPAYAERRRAANRAQKEAKNRIYNERYYPARRARLLADPDAHEAWKARQREATARYRAKLRGAA